MSGVSGEHREEIAVRHLRACRRFGQAVAAGSGRWSAPSPCTEWDARAVVEHVIGFHDVLLLRPMGAKPERPKGDPAERWQLTLAALVSLFGRPGLFDGPIDVPAVGNNPPTRIQAAPLVGLLSQDVLIHTWDLARAVGADDRLDPDLCRVLLRSAAGGPDRPGPLGDVRTTARPTSRRRPTGDAALASGP